MQLNSGGWGMPTLISITMFATAQIDKNSATNSMTAPAPVLFPIVFNAFIHPLQNKNKTTYDNKIDTTLKNSLSNSQHRKVSVICMPYSNSKEPKHIFSAKMYWHFLFSPQNCILLVLIYGALPSLLMSTYNIHFHGEIRKNIFMRVPPPIISYLTSMIAETVFALNIWKTCSNWIHL